MGEKRTGPEAFELFAVGATVGGVANTSNAFMPGGQSISLLITSDADAGEVSFTLQHQDGGGWANVRSVVDATTWTAANIGIGRWFGALEGYALIPCDMYRVVFTTENNVANFFMSAWVSDVDTNERIGHMIRDVWLNQGLAPLAVEFVNAATLTDGGAGYPYTGYYPDPDGYPIGERRRFLVDLISTGTVVPDAAEIHLEATVDSIHWHTVDTTGWSIVANTDGIGGWISLDAVATEDLVEWTFELYTHIRWRIELPTGPSGPMYVYGLFHGR